MGGKVLIALLGMLKKLFGSENFTRAVLTLVENKQERKNEVFEERKEVRVEEVKIDLLKKQNKLDKVEHRVEEKIAKRASNKARKTKRTQQKESRKQNR